MHATVADREKPERWRAFAATLAGTAAAAVLALLAATVALDPFGMRAGPGRPPAPLVEDNGRFMYPQVARSGRFEAAVIGTSTARLLDPGALGAEFGARFASLALNAGTPWEQAEIARLFVRHAPAPRMLVLGLDRSWCDPNADHPALRVGLRTFPTWLYDEDRWNDLPHLLGTAPLRVAALIALARLGVMRPAMREDGYEVFTPPEETYDPARARAHLAAPSLDVGTPQDPPVRLGAAEADALPFPALPWLADIAARLPAGSRLVALFPPLHVSALPALGSREAAVDAACKARVARLLPGATVVDYRRRSRLTETDANFWDKLHYRLPIATAIVRDLRAATNGETPADGRYVLIGDAAPASASPAAQPARSPER